MASFPNPPRRPLLYLVVLLATFALIGAASMTLMRTG